MSVGLIYDPVYLEHDTGTHVENAQRLVATMNLLEESGVKDKLTELSPRSATIDEIAKVHALEYIESLKREVEDGGGWLDPDTYASKGSYKAALYAAGGVMTGVESVMGNKISSVFALVRPPGHHATCWHSMGFCLLNNVAIAAKFALTNYDISRILIIDFDVHHGNGTQDAFYSDPHVLYFSTHEYPFYPGSGSVNETGSGEGEGHTVNVPLVSGSGDEEYTRVFEDILAPVAKRYQPHLILVSAGYDAHWADNLAMMQVSIPGFARMVEIIKILSDSLCPGRLVFSLEGGYNLQALSASIRATFDVLLGNHEIIDPLGIKESKPNGVNFDSFIKMVQDVHQIKI